MVISKNKGFTIIELIVVIAIISFLATIVVGSVSNYIKTSRISATQTEVNEIAKALLVYKAEKGGFPDPDNCSGSGTSLVCQPLSYNFGSNSAKNLSKNRIDTLTQALLDFFVPMAYAGKPPCSDYCSNGTDCYAVDNTTCSAGYSCVESCSPSSSSTTSGGGALCYTCCCTGSNCYYTPLSGIVCPGGYTCSSCNFSSTSTGGGSSGGDNSPNVIQALINAKALASGNLISNDSWGHVYQFDLKVVLNGETCRFVYSYGPNGVKGSRGTTCDTYFSTTTDTEDDIWALVEKK
jgi:prepilin-type N-terminal cleavage/methylation domain-containing protein